MKKTLNCIFTVTGTVIGAGFISGRELVRFFGAEKFIPAAFVAAIFIRVVYILAFASRI